MAEQLSFSAIRSRHAELLRAAPDTGAVTPEHLRAIEAFVESIRLAGRGVADEDDREYLRSLLSFWGNWLYGQTRTYPNTNLEPAWGDVVGRDVVRANRSTTVTFGPSPVTLAMIGLSLVLAIGLLALIFLVIVPVFNGAPAGRPTATSPSVTSSPTLATPATPLPQILPSDTPTLVPPPTERVGVTATTTAVAASGDLPTPTAHTLSATRTPTPEGSFLPDFTPGTGGGGFVSIPVISVQVIGVAPAAIGGDNQVYAGRPVVIQGTYFNFQAGWRLFYGVTDYATGETRIAGDTLTIESDGQSGAFYADTSFLNPGSYGISLFVATTRDTAAYLQRLAEANAPIPPDANLEGVIRFADLRFVEAVAP